MIHPHWTGWFLAEKVELFVVLSSFGLVVFWSCLVESESFQSSQEIVTQRNLRITNQRLSIRIGNVQLFINRLYGVIDSTKVNLCNSYCDACIPFVQSESCDRLEVFPLSLLLYPQPVFSWVGVPLLLASCPSFPAPFTTSSSERRSQSCEFIFRALSVIKARKGANWIHGGIEWGHISLRQIFQTSAVEILNIADFFFSDT